LNESKPLAFGDFVNANINLNFPNNWVGRCRLTLSSPR